ncbi:MAG: metalloregulator ArsR/SmtB family transcription factor [Planctomycetota bacterium]|nr:metalloregulator ArsR/SmtB family transcription factor [Planctomycetota bacterium]
MIHQTIKDELYGHFARIGKAVSCDKRLEILDVLSQGERRVEALAKAAHLTIGNTSAHLKTLYNARLVERRKAGQQVFYRLASPAVFHFLRHLELLGRAQISEIEQLVKLHYEMPEEFEPVGALELLRRIRDDDILVIDVRPPEEYRAGHIPTALNVPPDEVQRRLAELPMDREIVAYCRGPYCLFSVEAAKVLHGKGFRVRRLEAGLPDWREQGYPVSEGDERGTL